jgi:zinc transport system substrate-binding protein
MKHPLKFMFKTNNILTVALRVGRLGAIALLLALAACSGQRQAKPVVAVTIPPQRQLLEQIAGDKIEICCLLSPGANPETYEVSVATMRDLQDARAYMSLGTLGFERSVAAKVSANIPGLEVVDCSHGIALLTGTHGHDHGHDGDGEADPHIWSSVRNARVIAANMCDALVVIDPANAAFYESRHAQLDHRLDSMDRAIAVKLAGVTDRAFMIWHPSLSYLAADYSLDQIAIGQEGKESSVVDTRDKIDRARARGAKVFFFQREFDSRQAQAVNDEVGAKIIGINPMNEDWEAEINNVVNAIYENR